MLSDDATLAGPTWSMRPEASKRLAESLARLGDIVGGSWTFQAAWDPPAIDERIALAQLIDLARNGRVGTSVKYLVVHPSE
jgi:hypothetical protein